jgi:hypothetical protein
MIWARNQPGQQSDHVFFWEQEEERIALPTVVRIQQFILYF